MTTCPESHLSDTDKGLNEMMPGAVHSSSEF